MNSTVSRGFDCDEMMLQFTFSILQEVDVFLCVRFYGGSGFESSTIVNLEISIVWGELVKSEWNFP